jgi:hypothetical protein
MAPRVNINSSSNLDQIPVSQVPSPRDDGLVDQITELPHAPASSSDEAGPAATDRSRLRERLRAGWAATRAALGSLLGLAPHVLHHVGILAGTALLAGVWGNLALYAVGLLLSIPMLKRLRSRFGSNLAPITGAAIFTIMFLFSAFVLGPAINPTPPAPTAPPQSAEAGSGHSAHHP